MKATLTQHTRLVSNTTTILNSLKRIKKIKDFQISDISQGQIKVVINLFSKDDIEIQLRSLYGYGEVEKIIRGRVLETKVSNLEKVELAEVA
jgi:hypothetical protein